MAVLILAIVAAVFNSSAAIADPFVHARGTQFILNDKEFYVTGANNHYLPWASEVEITRVLDDAVAMGANVIRTFLGPAIGSVDGSTVPTIWKFHNDEANSNDLNVHGNYVLYWDPAAGAMAINPDGMRRTDFLLAEAAKRHLKLLLSFIDYWAYTGGSQQMRAWYGGEGEDRFFFSDPRTVADYKAWIRFVIQRVNPLTGLAYGDDPTIFAWELMNESQAPAAVSAAWTAAMSAAVKSLDSNHMVASGADGPNLADFGIPTIDFVTWHGYPKYRGITPARFDTLIRRMCSLAGQQDKPVLLEEFGYARANTDPGQAQAYRMWLDTLGSDHACAGWLVWRLVARQDDGRYPRDEYDQFDIRRDDGDTWRLLSAAAHQGRSITHLVGSGELGEPGDGR